MSKNMKNKSVDEIEDEIDKVKQRNLAALRRSQMMVHETEEVGVGTLRELDTQHQQLRHTEEMLNNVDHNNNVASRLLTGIISLPGAFINLFRSAPPPPVPVYVEPPVVQLDKSMPKQSVASSSVTKFQNEKSKRNNVKKSDGTYEQQEDEALDDLTRGIASLRQMSQAMSGELDEQGKTIDKLNDHVDKTSTNLKSNTKRIHKALR